MLGHVLPEEAGQVLKAVRVVAEPVEADDPVAARRHVSSVLLAQSKRLFHGRAGHRAIVLAEEWLAQVGMPV